MSKPSTWLLAFRDGLEATFSVSLKKLESLFVDNATWIEDQRRRARLTKAKNERQFKAHQSTMTALSASVKKPRGRPKKLKTLLEKSATELSSEGPFIGEPQSAVVIDENSEPNENAVVTEPAAPKHKRAPKKGSVQPAAEPKKPRGRPPKNKSAVANSTADDKVSSLSGSAENLAIEALGTLRPEQPACLYPESRADQAPTSVKVGTPVIKRTSSPAEERPEPVYVLAKPELVIMSGSPIAKSPETPLKSLAAEIELEIHNPPDSHSRPRQSLVRVALAEKALAPPVFVEPAATTEQVEELKQITPKVESWTSQFLKAASAPEPAPTPVVEEVLVDVKPVIAPQIPAVPPKLKSNPALAHLQTESQPAAESPLTRARRIDSQNTWREQQLSKFFVSKTEILKSAMDTLKAVKDEERASKIMSVDDKIKMETGLAVVASIANTEPVKVTESIEASIRPEPVKAKESPKEQCLVEAICDVQQLRKSPRKKDLAPQMPVFSSPKKRVSSYPDVFKVVSPLKTKKDTLVLDSGPASPNFLTTCEAPALDDTIIPDEIVFDPLEEKVSDVFDVKTIPSKRETIPVISEEERLKRQRLRERQQLAIEKRNMQIKKAQETKAKQEEMFNPKPRPPTISVKAISTAAPSIMAKNGAPRPANGPTVSGLHKAAIFNASKSNLSNGTALEKPDFKTPAAKIRSPAPVKMAEKVVSSPMFPEIPSDEEDYLRKASEAGSRPEWAATPVLRAALMEQQNFPTDKIFDKIQPVRLEDIFKNKTFKRGRNSTIPFM